MTDYGNATIDLLEQVYARGASHAAALMRHSAREYAPGRHDLENPLTDEGRDYARRLGSRLPKNLTVRGYASPPERCMETAELVLDSHRQGGGAVTRHRPVEALGVFYALDQRKMWKGMADAGGLVAYLQSWFAGEVPIDAMMEPGLAATQVLRALKGKLDQPVAEQQLDLCVSHDITVHLVRDRLLGETVDSSPIAYLDALVLYRLDGELRLASHRGNEVLLEEG
jgi:broad specificity phosphatase PhoE